MRITKRIAFIVMVLSGIMLIGNYVVPSFTTKEAGSIGIIGGADGPTAIYTTSRLAPQAIAVIALFVLSLIVWLALHFKTKK